MNSSINNDDFMVIKWNGEREMGISMDGKEVDVEHAPLLREFPAIKLADKYGGKVIEASRMFPDDDDYDDYDDDFGN